MKVVKGEVFEGDSFIWRGQKCQVLKIDFDGVVIGFNYTKSKGFQNQIKLYFDAKKHA